MFVFSLTYITWSFWIPVPLFIVECHIHFTKLCPSVSSDGITVSNLRQFFLVLCHTIQLDYFPPVTATKHLWAHSCVCTHYSFQLSFSIKKIEKKNLWKICSTKQILWIISPWKFSLVIWYPGHLPCAVCNNEGVCYILFVFSVTIRDHPGSHRPCMK